MSEEIKPPVTTQEVTDQTTTPTAAPSQEAATTTPSASSPAPAPAPAPTPPQPDLAKIEGTVTETVSKNLLEKIGNALGLSKEEKKALPTDPDELEDYVRNTAKQTVDELMKAKQDEERKALEAQDKQLKEGAERFQQIWIRDYNELASLNRVPPITNANDKNDPGVIAKGKILTKLAVMLKENQAKGLDHVPTFWEVLTRFPNVLQDETVAGGSTPISGGGRSTTLPASSLPYDNLHNANVEDLVKRKYSGN